MSSCVHLSESELVSLIHQGSEEAFMEIYHRYKDRLAINLLRVLKDSFLVEEVLQELFLMLWEKRQQLDPQLSVGGFLFRSASNRTKNIFRQIAYDVRMREVIWKRMEEKQRDSEVDWLEKKEAKEALHALLDRLPPQQQKVYRLCKLEGFSYKEVSEKLAISETTVNSHIRHANRFLRREIDPLLIIFLYLFS